MCKVIVSFLILCLLFSVSFSTPPHPEALQKIVSGEMPPPVFMSDPGYYFKQGINQPSGRMPFQQRAQSANFNVLVILLDYSDQMFTTLPTDFDSLIFGNTYFGPGVSLREFYYRASYGNLNIVTVNYPSGLGSQGLAGNRYNYTAAGGSYTFGMGTYPNNSQGMCEEAVALVDPLVDFSNYDNDGDGYVDGIILIHAGRGGEISLDTLDMWSHKWQISPQSRDGVMIADYSVDSEYRYIPGDVTVGTFAHEFGHILGLPDLYDYDVPFDSYGLGYWSLMAYGGWNGDLGAGDSLSGSSPAFLDAWSRTELGFVDPINIPCYVTSVHIPAVEDSAVVYRLWTYADTTSPEYFLLENRQWLFTDTALAGSGALIYHIDENIAHNDSQWYPGQPPANHYKVALEQADNLYHLEYGTNGMDYFDPFFQGNNGLFNSASSPSSNDYYGGNTYVSMYIYSGSQYIMLADLDVGSTAAPNTPVITYPENGFITGYQMVTFSWDIPLCASYYHIQVDDDITFTSPVFEDSSLMYNYAQYTFHSLSDGEYYWRVRAGNTSGWSGWTATRSLFMDRVAPTGSVASSPDTTYSSSFLVNWSTGTDPAPSGGICSYIVYADSGSGWYIWLLDIDSLSAVYEGARDGVTYYFQARARDCALNIETQDPAWEPECSTYASITVVGYEYLPGDANMAAGGWPPAVIGADVTYLVGYFRGFSLICELDGLYAAADVNGDCNVFGSDVTYLVNYFRGQNTITWCTDYPPAWSVIPDTMPPGWPNCD